MPRPKKKRVIFHIPPSRSFYPDHRDNGEVTLRFDEIEAIRLIDLEHLDQSQCAEKMNIARTTAQNIINSAHQKIADALVNGKAIVFAGGDCEYVEDEVFGCCRNTLKSVERTGGLATFWKENNSMILAVTYEPENGEIFQHFGRTSYFKLYKIEDGAIESSEVVSTNGQGHGALAGVLKALGAEALICGGIGGGAQNAMKESGIKLFGGVTGSADEAVEAFVAGTLQYQEDIACSHHGGHGHGHGEGGCHHGEGHEHGGGCHHGEGHGHGEGECHHGEGHGHGGCHHE